MNKDMYLKKLLPIAICLLLISFQTSIKNSISAQVDSSGVALTLPISDTEVQSGDIICTQPQGNVRCDKEYSSSVFGIISDNPSVSIEDFGLDKSRLVLTSGVASVRVTSVNGNIEEGDLITTSEKPGIGQKATRNGFVIGTAIENYESDNPDNISKIQVALNIHPASGLTDSRGNLLQFIREGMSVPVFEPVESLRYILAALMVIISFTLGMVYFGRASRSGIEAVGRNPLAKKVIQLTIFTNIVLTIIIVLVGLAIAYLILIF